MDLLIIRHAIAFDRDPNRWRDDSQRPLSPAGIRRARRAAVGLRELVKPPDRLLTSPLLRALQTARILSEMAGWPRAQEASELSPGESPQALLDLLAGKGGKQIAVVGHQPALGQLLTACLIGGREDLPIEMKKHAVACVAFEGKVRAGHAALKWLATPRMLRALRRARD